MSRRGTTLVELMIVVAVLGILAAGALMATHQQPLYGRAAMQQVYAAGLLEWTADQVSAGQPPDPAVAARLRSSLPDAEVTVIPRGQTALLVVEWRGPMGRTERRTLTVFRGKP